MAGSRLGTANLRSRRWSFAGCVFDEASWSLTVDGERVPVEAKPLALLRELLERAGHVVSKDELLDAIWGYVTVVEASLPTAVYKLRTALRDDGRERCIIETVPSIGYRIAAPVELVDLSDASPAHGDGAPREEPADLGGALPGRAGKRSVAMLLAIAAAVAVSCTGIAYALFYRHTPPLKAAESFSQRDAANALRRLDVGRIEEMLAAGWNPNTPFDSEGNGAVNYVLNMCEWDRGHDRHRLLLVVRTLLDGGARLDRRNVWGDTPYSIAKADRYCGPDHPVTQMIGTLCYAGFNPLGDRCLASYELARRVRN